MNEELIRKQQDAEGRIARLETLETDVAIQKSLYQLIPTFQAIPSLRGLWFPGMTNDDNDDTPDYSLETGTMADGGTAPIVNVVNDIVPIIEFVPNDRYSAGDLAQHRITGIEAWVTAAIRGITVGGWFRLDRATTQEGLICKWVGAAALHYLLYKSNVDVLQFFITQTGAFATADLAAATAIPAPSTGWYWLVGRWSTTAKGTTVNDTHSSVASTRASIFAGGGADLWLGANPDGGGSDYLDGACQVAFVAASYLSTAHLDMLYHRTKILVA